MSLLEWFNKNIQSVSVPNVFKAKIIKSTNNPKIVWTIFCTWKSSSSAPNKKNNADLNNPKSGFGEISIKRQIYIATNDT